MLDKLYLAAGCQTILVGLAFGEPAGALFQAAASAYLDTLAAWFPSCA
ncbi:MAG: hypothetical protein ABL901_09155 [Hyphomicrobiaceae bacterium]